MTGQDLKNSILQLAIQGKLVPHDANDEPASVLLERIKAEKQKLINEKKIKKEKPLPEITDEEKPFEIPESWEWVRLGEITTVKSSKRVFEKDYVASGVPFFRSKEIGELSRGETIKTELYITESHYHKLKSDFGIPQVGDILICSIGASIGNTWICDGREFYYKDGNITQICSSSFFSSQYIDIFLHSNLFFEQAIIKVSGTAYNALTIVKLNNLRIPLPPLSEQHRIVAKIEELMPLVEEYDKAQKELDALNAKLPEALKKSILQEAIQGKLVPQDPNDEPASVLLQRIRKEKEQLVKDGKLKKKDLVTTPITDEEKPFEIPESWEWCRMRDLCNFATPNKKDAQLVCLDARYLRGKGEGVIMSRGNYVDKGQYIILVDGENSGEVFITPCKGFLGSTFKELLITEEINFDFLKYIFLIIKEELRQNKRGAAIPHLDKVLFFEHLIPLPPLAEQHRIVSKIEDLFAQIEPLAKALSTPM